MGYRFLKARPVLSAGMAACLGVLAVGMVTRAPAVSEGVAAGLQVCGNILIPSLFPFMVLAVFLSQSEAGRILSMPLAPVIKYVYKLPEELGVVVLLSLIGGYPVGAKMIAGLLERGSIDRRTAERMLCFCVNSGPSFLVTAVGVGVFRDRTAGVILFATQTLATLIIGWVVSLKAPVPQANAMDAKRVGIAETLVGAVSTASGSMVIMCAFAVFFSGIFSLLSESGIPALLAARLPIREEIVTAVFSGFFEVTGGCIASARVGGLPAFGMASGCLSFCGLSVLFQVMSCFGDRKIRFRPMILSRLSHGILAAAMALPLYRHFCRPQAVWLPATPPQLQTDSRTTLISVCLLAMCAIFSLSLIDYAKHPKYNREKH